MAHIWRMDKERMVKKKVVTLSIRSPNVFEGLVYSLDERARPFCLAIYISYGIREHINA